MSSTATVTKSSKTSTDWNVDFQTTRRHKLFRETPTDRTAFPLLHAAIKPHVDSFNALFDHGLIDEALKDIGVHTVTDGDPRDRSKDTPRNKLELRVTEILLDKPVLPPTNRNTINREIFPAECRERGSTYRGKLRARLQYRLNNAEWKEAIREIGAMPIMLRSNRCHLEGLAPADMVKRREESEELGGYFIVNGNEKLIRMLITPKRNYPMATIRPSFENRGPTFSKFGIIIRSVRPDQTSTTNVLHYLTDGNISFRFSWRKSEYLLPVVMVLKALVETNDHEIAQGIVGTPSSSDPPSSFISDRVELLLRTYKAYGLKTRRHTLAYLGDKFRPVLQTPITMSDERTGEELLRKVILPHLGNINVTSAQNNDKYQMVLFSIRKLYALAAGDCAVDNPDAVANQEVLLGPFLYGMILKESLQNWLVSIGFQAREWTRSRSPPSFADSKFESEFLPKVVRKTNENIAQRLEYFLSTGNLVSESGLDQSQTSGYTVMAEKINFYRFISHFRCIHRGAFFAQLKTTTVRKLLPESWGFLCPVHTPDGSPCGLLNHLAHQCIVQTHTVDASGVEAALSRLGLTKQPSSSIEHGMSVQLDGRVLGHMSANRAKEAAQLLRHWKVQDEKRIPKELEIAYVPTSNGGLYPGLYMFSGPSRMIRPVKYIPTDKIDYVGPLEQQYMDIACTETDIIPELTTHIEFKPTNILSILANMTPFSDFNQSPRNMYQCQMSKQAMGTPSSNMMCRSDNKAYLLQTGQTPVVRPPLYNDYGLDNFPNGMNAVVAVIAYTGYDMDDAMIINKSAHERGFGDGVIYKTKFFDLAEKSGQSGRSSKSKTEIKAMFGFAAGDASISAAVREHIDEDGLPRVGTKVAEGSVIAAYHTVMFDPSTNSLRNLDGVTHYIKYKDAEGGYIDQIRLLGAETGDQPLQIISIKFRIPRRPVIGDKFSSRHGQKGVCSMLWPAESMPFSESGMQPDVIINPHAFPSRMTIGMFVESLAGKAGALHGMAQDCTPFSFDEDNTAGDFFGQQLLKAGYNYNGNEPMYSGITGKEFAADIYLGVVYYQRLRHMVSDKFQVRTTGPVNAVTGQPIKGRAKGGGIRVGEMERDSLIAHGCAYLLQDRLMDCSDKQRAWICKDCGSFLSVQMVPNPYNALTSKRALGGASVQPSGIVRCRTCARDAKWDDSKLKVWADGEGREFVGGENTTVVNVPGVLRFLDVELAAMGVKTTFTVT